MFVLRLSAEQALRSGGMSVITSIVGDIHYADFDAAATREYLRQLGKMVDFTRVYFGVGDQVEGFHRHVDGDEPIEAEYRDMTDRRLLSEPKEAKP